MAEFPPVLLLAFNRPDATKQVLDALRRVEPKRLFVAIDGPRNGNEEDTRNCAAVRRILDEGVNWQTQKLENISNTNLGLRSRVASAIDWAFGYTDRLIIVEDDCLPSKSFFMFCHELLERYADDDRVGSVCGSNFQKQPFNYPSSYYFSRYSHCWGWATWKRAWAGYDVDMADWPHVRASGWLEEIFPHPLESGYWKEIFDDTQAGGINTWDYQWVYHCWKNGQLAAIPAVNLVKNIGTGDSATNTRAREVGKHHLTAEEIATPLVHPLALTRNVDADAYSQHFVFGLAKDTSLIGRSSRLFIRLKRSLGKRIERTISSLGAVFRR
jgi:hypothetical protein